MSEPRVVLVTGASSGIGEASAARIAGPFLERIAPAVRPIFPDRLFLRIVARFYGLG